MTTFAIRQKTEAMNTSASTAGKTSISFRWDTSLVDSLREEATRQNTSPDRQAETIVREALREQRDVEDEDIPNAATMAAIEEAEVRSALRAKGLPTEDKRIDTSSVEAMLQSILTQGNGNDNIGGHPGAAQRQGLHRQTN